MDLYLQFGWGMMEHCKTLVKEWQGGTVILSPRDLKPDQCGPLATDIIKLKGGCVMLDPQFYIPRSDHERLTSHAFWPADYSTVSFLQGSQPDIFLSELLSVNDQIGSCRFILPGLLATEADELWLRTQRMFLDRARALGTSIPLCQTIAISEEVTRSTQQVARILEHAADSPAPAYYVVCQHPQDVYLVDNEMWLANVIDLIAGLRLLGSEVILGYCNHQMLIAGAAKATAIASGTWMNVRAFTPGKFKAAEEEERRKSVWYYAPRELTEYQLPTIELARESGLGDLLFPPREMENPHASALFRGGQFNEQSAFRHYLSCLRVQARQVVRDTFDETITAYKAQLDEAEALLNRLHSASIKGKQRDFRDKIDTNRAALARLEATRGGILRRRWSSL